MTAVPAYDATPLLRVEGLKVHFPIKRGHLLRQDGRPRPGRRRRRPRRRARARPTGWWGSPAAASRRWAGRSCGWSSRPRAGCSSTAPTSPRSRASRCGTCASACRWSSRTRWAASTRGRTSSRCCRSRCARTASAAATKGIAREDPRPARRRRPAVGRAAPLPARVLRRSAAAHRHRPRARAGAGPADRRRAGLRARRRRCRRRCSTCSRSCRSGSGSPTWSSPTTSPSSGTSATSSGSCTSGSLVEQAPADELYEQPLHPYTRSLMSAVPVPDPVVEERRERILLAGDLPSPANPPSGCRFHTRCPWRQETRCDDEVPVLRELAPGRLVSCHWAEEIRDGVLQPEVGRGGRGDHGRRRPAHRRRGRSRPTRSSRASTSRSSAPERRDPAGLRRRWASDWSSTDDVVPRRTARRTRSRAIRPEQPRRAACRRASARGSRGSPAVPRPSRRSGRRTGSGARGRPGSRRRRCCPRDRSASWCRQRRDTAK